MAGYSLGAFVERVFLPLESSEASDNYRWQCRRAVADFETALDVHPAPLSLLSQYTALGYFTAWLRQNAPSSYVDTLPKRLRSIRSYAAMLGLIELPCGEPEPPDPEPWEPVEFRAGCFYRCGETMIEVFYDEFGALMAREVGGRIRRASYFARRPFVQTDEVFRYTKGSLREFFEFEYQPKRMAGTKPTTVDQYRRTLRQLDEFAGRKVMTAELCDDLAGAFFRDRLDGRCAVTVNGTRAELFCIWRYAYERGAVDVLPNVKKLPEQFNAPDSWSVDEMRAILDKCFLVGGDYQHVPSSHLLRAVILTGYWTGLRRGTLFRLRWCDVDLESRWITVPGDKIKNRRGKQFRIGADAAAALDVIRRDEDPYVFPNFAPEPFPWKRFYADLQTVLDAAGVRRSVRRRLSKLHKLRRTTATQVAKREGIEAAASLLGHSSEYVTLRYVDQSEMPGTDKTEVLPALEGGH